MGDFLNSGLASIFASAFNSLYLDAVLHGDSAPVYSGGAITGYTSSDVDCKAQLDSCSYAMRQDSGYIDGDMRIIVLASGLGRDVTTDDELTIRGTRWKIASVAYDPAKSYFECRGRRA